MYLVSYRQSLMSQQSQLPANFAPVRRVAPSRFLETVESLEARILRPKHKKLKL